MKFLYVYQTSVFSREEELLVHSKVVQKARKLKTKGSRPVFSELSLQSERQEARELTHS